LPQAETLVDAAIIPITSQPATTQPITPVVMAQLAEKPLPATRMMQEMATVLEAVSDLVHEPMLDAAQDILTDGAAVLDDVQIEPAPTDSMVAPSQVQTPIVQASAAVVPPLMPAVMPAVMPVVMPAVISDVDMENTLAALPENLIPENLIPAISTQEMPTQERTPTTTSQPVHQADKQSSDVMEMALQKTPTISDLPTATTPTAAPANQETGVAPPAPAVPQSANQPSPPSSLIQAPAAQAVTTAAMPVAASPVLAAPIIVEQISLQVKKALDDGISRVRIKLQPAALGQVEVRMEVSSEGKLQAIVQVDKPQTLQWLQREAASLERTLTDAGFKLDSGALSFQFSQHQQQTEHQSREFFAPKGAMMEAEIQVGMPIALPNAANNNALDIKV
jgi:flagellar hook-length control protein FliK